MSGIAKRQPWPHAALTPPATLSDEASTLFRQIVASVDPHHFAASDRSLLIEYVRAAELANQAATELQAGAVVDGKVSPWVTVQEKAVRSLVALSGRLRLSPQSRFDRLVAGKTSRRQPSGPRPWDPVIEGDEPHPVDEFAYRPVGNESGSKLDSFRKGNGR